MTASKRRSIDSLAIAMILGSPTFLFVTWFVPEFLGGNFYRWSNISHVGAVALMTVGMLLALIPGGVQWLRKVGCLLPALPFFVLLLMDAWGYSFGNFIVDAEMELLLMLLISSPLVILSSVLLLVSSKR